MTENKIIENGDKTNSQQRLDYGLEELESMRDKAKNIAKLLDNKKGENITILDLNEIHSYLSLFLIVSANSVLHARSLVKEIRKNLKELEIEKNHTSDEDSPDWIIIDCYWLVIHIFTPATRDFFALEKLWADAKIIEWQK